MSKRRRSPKNSAAERKIKINAEEMEQGRLHSGSKSGPLVTDPAQMLAISYSQARKMKKRGRKAPVVSSELL